MKVVIVHDFIKLHYVREDNNHKVKDVYWQTEEGRRLKYLIKLEADKQGLDLHGLDIEFDYAYHKIPEVLRKNRRINLTSYVPVKQTDATPQYEALMQRLKEAKPDIVVPTGNMACKAVLGKSSITAMRGKPEKVDIDGVTFWALPIFSMAAMMEQPRRERLVQTDMRLLINFLKDGDKAFIATPVKYFSVTDNFEQVKEIFEEIAKHGKTPEDAVAWDYESNHLHGEREGAKFLTISFSWAHATGVTIPIEHREHPWSPEHLAQIKQYMKEFLEAPIYKVGHNIAFDVRETKLLISPKIQPQKILDTKVAFFIAVSQAQAEAFGLKTLAYQFTDMGNYEAPLNEYKEWFKDGRPLTGTELKAARKAAKKVALDQEKKDGKTHRPKAVAKRVPSFLKLVELSRAKERPLVDSDYLSSMDEESKQVALNWANHLLDKFGLASEVKNEVDGGNFDYEWVPYSILGKYAAGDVDCTRRINVVLYEKYIKPNEKWNQLYIRHYPEVQNTLSNIEVNGIQLDVPKLKRMREAFIKEQQRVMGKIKETEQVRKLVEMKEKAFEIGLKEKAKSPSERNKVIYKENYERYRKPESREFSAASPNDLHMVLFCLTGFTLPAEKKYLRPAIFKKLSNHKLKEDDLTWDDYSTGKDSMNKLVEDHPDFALVQELSEYRKLDKLVTTYTDGLIEKTDKNDVLHGHFNITGTETTRLSSSEPNMQNIPRHTSDARKFTYNYPIKTAFKPLKHLGHDTFLLADFDSQEMHLASVIAQDEDMIGAFLKHEDIHTQTAMMINGIPESEVTDDIRSAAKSTSFGLLYGETPESYYRKHEIIDPETQTKRPMTLEDAQRIFKTYFAEKPKFKQMIDNAQQEVKEKGYSEIPGSGFRRNLQGIWSNSFKIQNEALRQALNTKIQGGSAYITQTCLVMIDEAFRKFNLDARIVITVHDSIGVSTKKALVPKVYRVMKTLMEQVPLSFLDVMYHGKKIHFPMEAEINVAQNYNDECPYNEEEFVKAHSTSGYCDYYEAQTHLKDKFDVQLITEDNYKSKKADLESHKQDYMTR